MNLFRKAIASLISILILLNISTFNVHALTQQLEVHYINVGQGESIYIELPDGTDILIDAGKTSAGSTVVNYLKGQENNIDIEYLIATHPDADHAGGMQQVFKDLYVKNFYYPFDAPSDTKTWGNVLSLAKSEGCRIVDAKSNTLLNIGGVAIKLIQPNKNYTSDNDDSLVTYIDYKDAEFLFNGDIEDNVEKDMLALGIVPKVDFMSVPHHGSSASSTLDFLKTASPKYSIISVGKNSYGHPTQEVLNRLGAVGSKIYRTDIDGNVVIKTNGSTATINNKLVSIGSTPQSDWGSHWASKEIQYAMDKAWVNTSNTFRPDDAITRAEFIKIVNKAFGFKSKVFEEPFIDVNKSEWWYNEVLIAIKAKYITTKNERFRPNDPITREEVASIITSIKGNKDSTLDKLNTYKDKQLVAEWAQTSVEGAIEAGYMGKNSDTFNPKKNITRAESIVTLYRVVK